MLINKPLTLIMSSLVNFDKEGSKFEKKMFVSVCGGEGGGMCNDTKTVCKTVFFLNIFFFNF